MKALALAPHLRDAAAHPERALPQEMERQMK
jgi:hypothetical protein